MAGHSITSRQQGITLLEVLVGFVIFTASLVAILDFVSGQIFHVHRSASNLQRLQGIYQTLGDGGLESLQRSLESGQANQYSWTVAATELDAIEMRKTSLQLNRYDYSIADSNNELHWTVVRIR